MLENIKKQFYNNTIKELLFINAKLSEESIHPNESISLVNSVFSITHQISGTGPMLGFMNTSKISKKVEKTFYEIRAGEKELTAPIIMQTRRALESIIDSMNQEFNSSLVISE